MVAMDAQVWPPPVDPAKSDFFSGNGLGPDCALDDVGVDLGAAVVEDFEATVASAETFLYAASVMLLTVALPDQNEFQDGL